MLKLFQLALVFTVSLLILWTQPALAFYTSGLDQLLELKGYTKSNEFSLENPSVSHENPYEMKFWNEQGNIMELTPLALDPKKIYVFAAELEDTYNDCYRVDLGVVNARGEFVAGGDKATTVVNIAPSASEKYYLLTTIPVHDDYATCNVEVTEYSGYK